MVVIQKQEKRLCMDKNLIHKLFSKLFVIITLFYFIKYPVKTIFKKTHNFLENFLMIWRIWLIDSKSLRFF